MYRAHLLREVGLFCVAEWAGGVVRLPLQEAFKAPGMGFVEQAHVPRSSGSAPRCDTAELEQAHAVYMRRGKGFLPGEPDALGAREPDDLYGMFR